MTNLCATTGVAIFSPVSTENGLASTAVGVISPASSCHLSQQMLQLSPLLGIFCLPTGQPQGPIPSHRSSQGWPSIHCHWGHLTCLLGGHSNCHLLLTLAGDIPTSTAAGDTLPVFWVAMRTTIFLLSLSGGASASAATGDTRQHSFLCHSSSSISSQDRSRVF